MKYLALICLLLLYSCNEQSVDYNEPLETIYKLKLVSIRPDDLLPEYQQYAELEGFYTEANEVSNFNLLQGDKLLDNMMWTEIDSLPYDAAYPHSRGLKRGVYMKVGGIRQWGRCYGHFGASESKFTVTKILAIDTTRTRFDYIMNEARRNGYYVNGADTLYLPTHLQPGRQYKFRGEGSFLSNDEKMEYQLIASTKDGTTADYSLMPMKGAKACNTFAGTLNLDLNDFLGKYGNNTSIITYHNQDFTNYWLYLMFQKDDSGNIKKVSCAIDGRFILYADMFEVTE